VDFGSGKRVAPSLALISGHSWDAACTAAASTAPQVKPAILTPSVERLHALTSLEKKRYVSGVLYFEQLNTIFPSFPIQKE